MRLFKKGEWGHYAFVHPHLDPTGKEVPVGDGNDIPFEGKGLNIGMVQGCDLGDQAAVIFYAGLENPTWDVISDVAERVNRAWRSAYGDTYHRFFEGASLHGDIIWLWFGS
jgi:hypothetical protein